MEYWSCIILSNIWAASNVRSPVVRIAFAVFWLLMAVAIQFGALA